MATKTFLCALATVLVLATTPAMAQNSLSVDAQAAQGFAAPGNNQAANFLILVTNSLNGAPVTNLTQTDFSIINHFGVPGQVCGFSNNIVQFGNIGTGAYQIQVRLTALHSACAWVKGDYLAQIIVDSPQGRGQVAVKLSIQ